MKLFRLKNSEKGDETLTVGELKTELNKYPDTMPVLATWEGLQACIHPDNFTTEETHKGNIEDLEVCVIIDVEYY